MTTLWPSPSTLTDATAHQRERIELATRRPVGVLGGNPGSGKSHCSGEIVKRCAEEFGIHEIAVCAPTGKAAVRITAAILKHGVDIQAATIHRQLGVSRNGHDKTGWGFQHDAANPLPKRFVFVDEASMLSTSLLASLLAACNPGTHILFIGDFAQLPPVEHGAPLRDLIAAGLPYGELTETHRNGGDIVQACLDLKEGRPIRPSRAIDIPAGKNLLHIEAQTPSLALGALGRLLRSTPVGIDPVWDVQVLCAVNKKSDVGRLALNTMLQKNLNPHGERLGEMRFRIGDKVICGTNCLLPLVKCMSYDGCEEVEKVVWQDGRYVCGSCGHGWRPSDCAGEFVANGEIGRVESLAVGVMHVRIDFPRRTVRVAGEWLDEWELGYAITGHKSQGSQWPYVISMIDDSKGADRVTSWEWHRTAVSRAEALCVTIGRKGTLDRQCKRSALATRKTFLTERLKEELAL